MELTEAINYLKDKIKGAEFTNSDYSDCVDIEAIKAVVNYIDQTTALTKTNYFKDSDTKVGNKYIIEIAQEYVPDYPTKLCKDSLAEAPKKLYRVVGFNSLVFDEKGLSKLTPLDVALDYAYDTGYKEGIEEGHKPPQL